MKSVAREATLLWRSRALLVVLVRREVAARHAGTALGIAWPYLQPLLALAAYFLVFDIVFKFRMDAHAPTSRVGAYLIVGALPWMAFCDAVSRGMTSLLEAGSILQKNALPPVLFPVRSALASSAIYCPLLLLVALAYTPYHHFAAATVALLGLLILQTLLCTVLGYFLAILSAALRDTAQIVGFLLTVGIYLSPALFPVTLFPEQWRWTLWANPMTGLMLGYQSVLLKGAWPPADVWLFSIAWIAVLTVLLDSVVRRSKDQLIDWL